METKIDYSLRALFTFYYSTRVPVYLFEYSNQNKTSLGEIPVPLERLQQEEHHLILQQMKQTGRIHHVTDPYHRHYLAINTKSFASIPEGYICIGPFLYGGVNANDIQRAFEKQGASIHVSRKIKSYYDQLPVIPAKQMLYYGQILLALLSSDWSTPLIDQTFDQLTFIPKKTDQNQDNAKFLSQSYQLEKEFLSKLQEGDPSAIDNLSHAKFYPAPSYGKENAIRTFKNRLIATTTLVARSAIESGVEEHEALSMSHYYIHELEQKNKLEDLLDLEKVMVYDYLSKIQKYEERDHSPLMQACLEKVHTSLHKPLSIEKLAKELEVRADHLSALFKREVGLSLQQYVHRQKMKEVKKALLQKNDSIVSVAEQYGYNSASHFSRLFKKYEGISPSLYRKQNR